MWVRCTRCGQRFPDIHSFEDHYCSGRDRQPPRPIADGGIRLPGRLGDDAIGPNMGCFNINSSLVHAGGTAEFVSAEVNPDPQYGVIDFGITWDDGDVDVYLSIDLDAEEARELAGVLERCAFAVEEVDDGE